MNLLDIVVTSIKGKYMDFYIIYKLNNVISYRSPVIRGHHRLDKTRLIILDNHGHNRLKPISNNFCNDFKKFVT